MNRKFLVMIATICGLVMMIALLLFPLIVRSFGDESDGMRAIQGESGPWLLLFTWLAFGFSMLVFVNKATYIGIEEAKCRMLSLMGFKLAGFFFLAHLIAGTGNDKISWGFGFWLAFIASVIGAFAVYLTFNESLAQKIAAAAHDVGKGDEGKSDEGAAAEGGDAAAGES